MKKILIIQTAFIGDVILATPVIEKLHQAFPDASIDFLLKKGHEGLFSNHPYLDEVITWDKKTNKYSNLIGILKAIRGNNYDLVVNLQRFASSGFLTACSKAKVTIGFHKNPFSIFFSKRVKHRISKGNEAIHEIDRNLNLVEAYGAKERFMPRLYPSLAQFGKFEQLNATPYICIAPASVWFTKQYPKDKWIDFLKQIDSTINVCLIGSANDRALCDEIINESGISAAHNYAGELSLLDTAALMKNAMMNFVNDSAPMHMASAMNAPVAAIYCSTVPAFGFGPLSDHAHIIETPATLACRPCGLHGFNACPEKHFACAYTIETSTLLSVLN